MSNDNKTLADVQPGGRVRLGTPGARWAATGEPDPHGTRYDCERSDLAMGNLSDDELANAVFINGDRNPTFAQMTSGELPGSAYLTAAKDRIRWLSRALAAAEALSAQPSPGGQGVGVSISDDDRAVLQRLQDALPTAGINGWAKGVEVLERLLRDSLAALQPVGEPVDDDWHLRGYAYASKQATTCAGCGKHKHTPLRVDAMGGHVCLTCIDHKLGALLGEFGYPPAQAVDLGTGVKAIAAERKRQLHAEGFTRDSDRQYQRGELAKAATAYVQLAAMDLEAGTRNHIACREPAAVWPWAPEWWKPVDARRDLVRAGALIAAQIDHLDSLAVGNG